VWESFVLVGYNGGKSDFRLPLLDGAWREVFRGTFKFRSRETGRAVQFDVWKIEGCLG
jgi:hypothetical protein